MAVRQPPIHLSLLTPSTGSPGQLPRPPMEITPPATPTVATPDAPASLASSRSSPTGSRVLSPAEPPASQAGSITNRHVRTPHEFPDVIETSKDTSGRPIEFGRGVWSVVYMASSHPPCETASVLMTPPSSPGSKTRILAVKTPARRDAQSVLRKEALILTRLSLTPGHENHVVPFRGYISSSHSIVMSAVPLALSTYIEEEAETARKQLSTQTMFDPIQGKARWYDLAHRLISALSWLHNEAQIVHGDVKPHSFLLRPRQTSLSDTHDGFPYEPVFADFSSAHDLTCPTTENGSGSSMSALTPAFAAPELLSVHALTSPDVNPTPASDVFSLAVTLLAAATGDLLVYPGTSNMQRLAMAREGHRVLEFARSGGNGSRIPRNGMVEQTLMPAIAKDPIQRITAGKWLSAIQTLP